MERKYANRPGWKRILQQRFYLTALNTAEFNGYIGLLCMDAVREPLVLEFNGQPICLVDNGYAWLQHFPTGVHYTMTTHFDAHGQVVQWYIDICLQTGVDASGMPWFDDLYLDIVITVSGETILLDADELEAALQKGEIDQSAFDLAWREARGLLAQIEQGTFRLPELSESHRRMMLDGVGV